jgi:hypothetical protein
VQFLPDNVCSTTYEVQLLQYNVRWVTGRRVSALLPPATRSLLVWSNPPRAFAVRQAQCFALVRMKGCHNGDVVEPRFSNTAFQLILLLANRCTGGLLPACNIACSSVTARKGPAMLFKLDLFACNYVSENVSCMALHVHMYSVQGACVHEREKHRGSRFMHIARVGHGMLGPVSLEDTSWGSYSKSVSCALPS